MNLIPMQYRCGQNCMYTETPSQFNSAAAADYNQIRILPYCTYFHKLYTRFWCVTGFLNISYITSLKWNILTFTEKCFRVSRPWRRNAFTLRTVGGWDGVPERLVAAGTVREFEHLLENRLGDVIDNHKLIFELCISILCIMLEAIRTWSFLIWSFTIKIKLYCIIEIFVE